MKRLRIVVAVALLALAPAPVVLARPAPATTALDTGQVVGRGFWDTVACGACLGGFVALSTVGWGALSGLVFTVGDGACIDACIAVF